MVWKKTKEIFNVCQTRRSDALRTWPTGDMKVKNFDRVNHSFAVGYPIYWRCPKFGGLYRIIVNLFAQPNNPTIFPSTKFLVDNYLLFTKI